MNNTDANLQAQKELILDALQFYIDSAQEFLSYDEYLDMKYNIEDACKVFGLA